MLENEAMDDVMNDCMDDMDYDDYGSDCAEEVGRDAVAIIETC